MTWVFPKAAIIPDWLSGNHNSIAIRMTGHPGAHKLCADGPIVSTSANISGHEPAVDLAGVCAQFPYGVDAFLAGHLSESGKLSEIYDVYTSKRLR